MEEHQRRKPCGLSGQHTVAPWSFSKGEPIDPRVLFGPPRRYDIRTDKMIPLGHQHPGTDCNIELAPL